MLRKSILFAFLAALFALLCACGGAGEEANVSIAAPTPDPTVAVVVATIPVQAVTPTPTLTPEPTPEPTAEPRPTNHMGEAEYRALMMDVTSLRLVSLAGKSITLYEQPSEDAASVTLRNENTDPARSELIVLGEHTADDGTLFYQVRAAFSDAEGYVLADRTRKSVLSEEQISGFGLLARPGCAVYRSWNEDSVILAREGYHAVRVLGSYRDFYYVVTQNGVRGFVDAEQVQMLDRARIEQYLADGQLPDSAEMFSLSAFTDTLEAMAGREAASAEALIVSELTRAGLFFSPGYYTYFQKRFTDEYLYPQGYYLDPVYNSLLFKLWNSAGDQVFFDGHETQWAYIADYAHAQRGDLLFFAEYGKGDTAVVKSSQVVFRGRYSGYVTACGVYLGDDRMLTVSNGVVEIVENLSATDRFRYFDCARRILSNVMDKKEHMNEQLIAAIYDRLGTPYSQAEEARTGDRSYDCSGIICWVWRSMGFTSNSRNQSVRMEMTTASGLSNLKKLYRGDEVVSLSLINELPEMSEDIAKLERGDLVFLLNESRSRIRHVMVYLGNGHVIHSTTVYGNYRGTLVAIFREELQKLYYHALRISEFT